MKTEIIKVNPDSINPVSIKIAAKKIKDRYGEWHVESLGPGDDLTACAANLFSVLREFDKQGANVIIAEAVKEDGLGLAIMDRLRKAAGE